jgi:hypothetical protein
VRYGVRDRKSETDMRVLKKAVWIDMLGEEGESNVEKIANT